MKNRIDSAEFKRLAKAGRPAGVVTRSADGAPTPGATGGRRISFVFSDETVDRDFDVVRQSGWILDAFKKNPIILFGHDSSRPENVIGRAENVRVSQKQLLGDVVFADASANPVAETVYQLYQGKFLSAVSVGYLPIEFEFSREKSREGGVDFLRQELLEVSCVPCPANSNALAIARSKGIAVSRIMPFLKAAGPAPGRPSGLLGRVRAMPKSIGQAMARGMSNQEIKKLTDDGWIDRPANQAVAINAGWSGADWAEAKRRGLVF